MPFVRLGHCRFPVWGAAQNTTDQRGYALGAGAYAAECKEAFPRDRESFFYRPIDLLGICIGTAMCPAVQHEDRNWLQSVLSEGEKKVDPQSVWNYFLSGFAAHILGVQWQERMTPLFESLAISELALLKWLLSHPNAPLWTSLDRRRIDEALLRSLFLATAW